MRHPNPRFNRQASKN
ncbi:hypothetical protein D039_4655A, partial [Vibrio parahaemolyticus EKP-028]